MKDFEDVVKKFASDTSHWIEVRAILQEEINFFQEIIRIIDREVQRKNDEAAKKN
jgi:hypothetical protein